MTFSQKDKTVEFHLNEKSLEFCKDYTKSWGDKKYQFKIKNNILTWNQLLPVIW